MKAGSRARAVLNALALSKVAAYAEHHASFQCLALGLWFLSTPPLTIIPTRQDVERAVEWFRRAES